MKYFTLQVFMVLTGTLLLIAGNHLSDDTIQIIAQIWLVGSLLAGAIERQKGNS